MEDMIFKDFAERNENLDKEEDVKENVKEDKDLMEDIEKLMKNEINYEKTDFSEKNLNVTNEEEDIENEFEDKLVLRPTRNFVWGLGNETRKQKKFFSANKLPTESELVSFLESNNLTDIVIVPTRELGFKHLKPYNIVCSGYTSKHIYKVAKELSSELKKLNVPGFKNQQTISGKRDSEWFLIDVGDYTLNFFVESLRNFFRIEDVWLEPLTPEEIEHKRQMNNQMTDRKN